MRLKWHQATAARVTRNIGIACGALSTVALCASVTMAAPPLGGAPEISPSYATSALTLLAGGTLLLRSKVRR